MSKVKKLAVILASSALVLAIIFFVSKTIMLASYRNQIPELPELGTLSEPIKQQLTIASKIAFDHPTADNIGRLGMVYHSGAYYDRAKQCYKLAVSKDKSRWIWNYYLAYLDQEMGDSKAAIENFSSVVKINRHLISAWYYLGEAFRN